MQCINEAECIEVCVVDLVESGQDVFHVVDIQIVEEIEFVMSPVDDAIPRSSSRREDVIKEGGFADRSG